MTPITSAELNQLNRDDMALPIVQDVRVFPKPYKEAYKRAKQREALFSTEGWLAKLVESKG